MCLCIFGIFKLLSKQLRRNFGLNCQAFLNSKKFLSIVVLKKCRKFEEAFEKLLIAVKSSISVKIFKKNYHAREMLI